MRSPNVNKEQQQENRWAPRPVADLRNVALEDLLRDEDGAAADLRDQILDGDQRLPVAGFQAFI
jgi:hypothetical protein